MGDLSKIILNVTKIEQKRWRIFLSMCNSSAINDIIMH